MKLARQRVYLSGANDYWYNILYNFLKNYIPGLSHESESEYLNFNNQFKLRVKSAQDGTNCYIYAVFSDDTEKDLFGKRYMYEDTWFDLTYLESKGLHLFSCQRSYGLTITVLWVNDTNNNLYVGGYYVDDITQTINISRSTIYKITNTATDDGYTFPVVINFMAKPGNTCYYNSAPIVSGTSYVANIKDICCCSTVPLKSTVSVPDGSNYYAVSKNHLVRINEEDFGGDSI